MAKTLAERFWAKVNKDGPIHPTLGTQCWVWTAFCNPKGYGTFRGDGTQVAHRHAWQMAKGPIPDGLLVLHRCDNPPCVNPAHLFLGTHTDNMRDRDAKGRTYNGRAARTHCPRGHSFDHTNTGHHKNGARVCRTCNRDRLRIYRAKKGMKPRHTPTAILE